MNKEKFNTAFKTLKFAKDALYEVTKESKESIEMKQTPDLTKRIAVEFAFMATMITGMETLLRAEMERYENNDGN